jgi:hypothetical protein
MYKHGKPIYKLSRRPLLIISAILLLALGIAYYQFVVKNDGNTINNVDKPLISTVKAANQNTDVEEKFFRLMLPGKWKLSQKDWDTNYHAWQWQLQDNHSAGRWFRVYQDTIPTDYAYNYILPVTANGDMLVLGQMSGNCADFTTTAQTKTNTNGTIAAKSKWQQVDFFCDYGNQSHQVIGTSSPEAINSISLTGKNMGMHKFFFLMQDDNYVPDLGIAVTILSTFQAK